MEPLFQQSIEEVIGRVVTDEDDARKGLQVLLKELGVPCDGLNDLQMLFETAQVLTNNSTKRSSTPVTIIPVAPDRQVKEVHEHWLTHFIGSKLLGARRQKFTALYYPRHIVDDRKPFEPLIKVLSGLYPHLRFFFINRGLSVVNGTSAVLTFDRTHDFQGQVVGWLHLNAFSFETGEAELRATIPAEFLAPRKFWWMKGMRRWTIAPVSMTDVIDIATHFEVGLAGKTAVQE